MGLSWNVRTDQHGSKPLFIGSLNSGRILLVIILSLYSLTCQFSKFSNNWFWHRYNYSSQLKRKKKLNNRPKNHRFFVDSFMKTISSLRFLKNPKLKIAWFSPRVVCVASVLGYEEKLCIPQSAFFAGILFGLIDPLIDVADAPALSNIIFLPFSDAFLLSLSLCDVHN